jgi:uncharacterized membrane protein YebE (DUF533 family)
MLDANKILGMLMESGMSRSGQSRVQRMAAGSGPAGGSGPDRSLGSGSGESPGGSGQSPFAEIARSMLGGSGDQSPGGSDVRSPGSGQSPGGSGGGLADLARSMLGGDQSPGSGQRPGGGGGLADLAGSLLGGGGRTGGAFSGSAMGLLGMLASAAIQHFGSPQAAAQPGLAEDAAPYGDDPAGDEEARATVMIRAMIAAAKADGEIGPEEKQRILGRLEQAGADPDARAFIRDEMARPVDLQTIVSAVDSPHAAIEAYAASLFAIDIDTPAEVAYMRQLAQGLGLNPTLVRELHASLEAPKPH